MPTSPGSAFASCPQASRAGLSNTGQGSAVGLDADANRMTLGETTKLTADEARNAARDVLATVRLGGDPAGERRKSRKMPTVAQLLEQFLADEVEPKRKRTTASTYRHYVRNIIVPAIGTTKADALAKADVNRLHRKVGREHPTTANRVLAVLLRAYVSSSHYRGPRGMNPTRGVEKFSEESRERFLSSDELQRLGAALRDAETVGFPWRVDEGKATAKHLAAPERRRTVLSPAVVAALRLLLFTGCRLREILHLRWADVDFERGMLFLPESKTGRRAVILNAPALAVLDSLPRLGSFVIAGDAPDKPRSDLKRPWQAVAKHAGLEGLRIHDLRHSSPASARAPAWAFRSLGSSSATLKRAPQAATLIWTMTRCGARRKQSARLSRLQWQTSLRVRLCHSDAARAANRVSPLARPGRPAENPVHPGLPCDPLGCERTGAVLCLNSNNSGSTGRDGRALPGHVFLLNAFEQVARPCSPKLGQGRRGQSRREWSTRPIPRRLGSPRKCEPKSSR